MDELEIEVEKIDNVYKSLELSNSLFNSEAEFLHQKRLVMDPFIFESLKKLYGAKLKKYWDETPLPYQSDKAIVIVERRCNVNLEFVLHNFAYFARGYTIHIFCSRANLGFIQHICAAQIDNIHIHIAFDTIGTPEEGKKDYNDLLKTKDFWDTFKEEHILTAETDCYLIKPIPDSIYNYDYAASQWSWSPSEPGGGGLSYRKLSIMKKICALEDEKLHSIPMQDSFASKGITLLGGKYSQSYFTESMYSTENIGVHQWWTFYNINVSKYYILRCLSFSGMI